MLRTITAVATHSLTAILVMIGVLFLYLLVLPLPMSFLGYYPDGVGWEVAKEIVAKDGKAIDCRKIVHLISHPFSPTQGEQRASCVYEVAKLTKDPSACELLMPSSYGLSCVGGAMSDYVRPCALGKDRSVTWQNGGKATLSQCVQGYLHECCTVSQARFIVGFENCEGIQNDDIRDECKRGLAFKKTDPKYCDGILSPLVRAACDVEASGLQEDPSICQGCTKAINSLSELK